MSMLDFEKVKLLNAIKENTGTITWDDLLSSLETLEVDNGKLRGYVGLDENDEEVWVYLKANAQGELVLSADVTVDAEGLVVDLGLIKQGPAGEEAWLVVDEDVKDAIDALREELEAIKEAQTDGSQKVQLSGDTMSLFRATIEERPSADSVEVGTTFTLANAELDTWISNGTDWVEV